MSWSEAGFLLHTSLYMTRWLGLVVTFTQSTQQANFDSVVVVLLTLAVTFAIKITIVVITYTFTLCMQELEVL